MLEPMPRVPDFYYGVANSFGAESIYAQLRKLDEEKILFAKIAELLRVLEKVAADRYPQLQEAQELLRRKQVERLLIEAWSLWHDDDGNPDKAAKALEAFLREANAPAVCKSNEAQNLVLQYTAHLLTALLSAKEPNYRFGQSLPRWLRGTEFERYLNEYELLRKARLDFVGGRLQIARDAAAELARSLDCPWSRTLAYELLVDVLASSSKQHVEESRMLLNALNSWRHLWPNDNPLPPARLLEQEGFHARGGRIRWLTGLLAQICYSRGDKAAALRILELFTEEERQKTQRPGSLSASLQQLWTFLHGSQDEETRLVLELDRADEVEIKRWVETYDPCAKWGMCPKAVLVIEHTPRPKPTKLPKAIGLGFDGFLAYLRNKLSTHEHLAGANVERFRRAFRRGESETSTQSWVWLRPRAINDAFGALAFAVELEKNALNDDWSWMLHTLIELDRSEPAAWHDEIRKAIHLVNGRKPDLQILQEAIGQEIDNAMFELSDRGASDA